MDVKILLTVASVIAGVGFIFPYIRDIYSLKTQPHSYTWLIWTLSQGTAAAIAWQGGGNWGVTYLVACSVANAYIFFLSLKYGSKNITAFDTIVLLGALATIFVWWQLDNPVLAVLMASAIDLLGYFPSFRKTFEEPWSETIVSWVGFSTGAILAILALAQYNILTLPYLITIASANAAMAIICLARRPYVAKPAHHK